MKGFGRLRDRGPITLGKRHSDFKAIFVTPAAVSQVANAFHRVSPEKRCMAVDLRRKCAIGQTFVPYSNRPVLAMNRS